MPNLLAASAGVVLLLLCATPAAANESGRWTDVHIIDHTYPCGVVEHTVAAIDGTAYFDNDGTWLRDIIRFGVDSSFTDPASGRTITYTTRQVLEATSDTGTYRGQGFFVRVAGQGVIILDNGRMTFALADGTTVFASAHVLTFDDPTVQTRVDAAVCAMFGF
jgi:hypothetical protein